MKKKLDRKNCNPGPTATSYRKDCQNSLQNSEAFPRFPRFFSTFLKLARIIRPAKAMRAVTTDGVAYLTNDPSCWYPDPSYWLSDPSGQPSDPLSWP